MDHRVGTRATSKEQRHRNQAMGEHTTPNLALCQDCLRLDCPAPLDATRKSPRRAYGLGTAPRAPIPWRGGGPPRPCRTQRRGLCRCHRARDQPWRLLCREGRDEPSAGRASLRFTDVESTAPVHAGKRQLHRGGVAAVWRTLIRSTACVPAGCDRTLEDEQWGCGSVPGRSPPPARLPRSGARGGIETLEGRRQEAAPKCAAR